MTSGDQTLRFRPIAVAVAHTARRHAWRILVVSIVVSAVTVAVDAAADHLLDRADVTTAVVGAVSTSTVSLLGAVFLSGFLCRLVTVDEHGKTEHGKTEAEGSRIRDVLRSLPWGSLILADLLVALIVLIGLVALIIPGLIAITLLSVAGPVIELERQPAVAGLRRSVHLVRPHFWRVAALGDRAAAGRQRGDRHPAGPVRPHQRRDHPDRPVDRRRHRRSGGRPAAGGTVLPADRRRSRRSGRSRRDRPDRPAGGLSRARPPGPAAPGGGAR